MRDVLEKMQECGKDVKMRDFPHDCGMVDTYEIVPFDVRLRYIDNTFICLALPTEYVYYAHSQHNNCTLAYYDRLDLHSVGDFALNLSFCKS